MSRPEWFVKLLKLGWPRNPAQFKITRIPFIDDFVAQKFLPGDEFICLPKDNVIDVVPKVSLVQTAVVVDF